MYTSINYNPQRKTKGDTYFLQYPNGNNLAALWKMFGNVRIEHDNGIIRNLEYRLFNAIDTNETELNMAIMNLPALFNKYDTRFIWGTPKKVLLTTKEEIKYLENTDWLVDTKTTRIVSQAEYEKIRGSIWFLA